MTLKEYQVAAMRTAPAVTQQHDLLHAALGLASEAGELINVIKREHAYGKPLDWMNMTEEAGDALWFIALYCRSAGITLEDLARANIAKLRARFPEKFDADMGLNRDTAAEIKAIESAIVSEASAGGAR